MKCGLSSFIRHVGVSVFITAVLGVVLGFALVPAGCEVRVFGAYAGAGTDPPPASRSASPRVVQGRIDVSGWDFSRRNLELDGTWELYFSQLLEPGDFAQHWLIPPRTSPPAASQAPVSPTARVPASAENLVPAPAANRTTPQLTGYVTVPGSWQSVTTEGSPPPSIPPYGFATYRLVVTGLPEASAPWAIEIPYARTAYRLWVNGRLVASNGVVSSDPAEMRPQYAPVTATIDPPPQGALELVMQISNAHFRSGGLPRSVVLGAADLIAREQQKRLMFQMFIIGAVGLMFVVYTMMYAWRPSERSTLYFALATGSVAFRSFLTGELPVVTVFPNLPWELLIRTEYIITNLGTGCFVLFLHSLSPDDVPRWIARFGIGMGVGGAVISLVLPVRLSSNTVPFYMALTAIFVYYGVYVFIRAWIKEREAIELTVAGGIIFLAAVFLTMFYYNQTLVNLDLVPFGIFVLLLSQGLTLSRRYALAFRQTEELARQNGLLLEETQRQLAERNRLSRLLAEQDERTRRSIAEMLHGRTQARLLAASQRVQQAIQTVESDRRQAVEMMLAARDLIDQVREEDIRDASHRLHPAAIAAGLIGALDALGKRLGDGIRFDFSIDPRFLDLDDPADNRLKENVRLALYRIVEEAFNNTQRHARAQRVQLSLRLVPEEEPVWDERRPPEPGSRIELVVADDGVGFDPNTVRQNLGLQLIAARVADLGGEWEITSAPGQGTRLWVSIPLEQATISSTPPPEVYPA